MQPALKILFVINPVSGGNAKTNWEDTIRKYFKQLGHDIIFLMLTGKNDAQSIKAALQKNAPGRVVAVGGDGTITLVGQQLLGTGIPMGIIPAGSANGMAKELNIPAALDDALDIVVNGLAKPADVIRINDTRISLHLSDMGINAQLIKHYSRNKVRGWLGYAKMVFKVLFQHRRIRVTVRADGKEVMRSAYMVVIANASKYGTGAVINPEGSVHDGEFEIVIVRRLAIRELAKMFIKSRTVSPKAVEIIHAKQAEISSSAKIDFQVDGEYIGKVTRVKAEILRGQLTLLIPAVKT